MALNWRGDEAQRVATSEFNYAGSYAIAYDGKKYKVAHIDTDGVTHELKSGKYRSDAQDTAEAHHLKVIRAHHKKLFG